jgi:hypothetical protein
VDEALALRSPIVEPSWPKKGASPCQGSRWGSNHVKRVALDAKSPEHLAPYTERTEQGLHMDKDTWDAVTAIGTALAAVFTAVMAWFTRKAITEGQQQRQEASDHFAKTREQDKQHHQDTFRPLLVLMPSSIANTLDRQDLMSCYHQGNLGVATIKCVVKNIGTGPAVNIRMDVRPDRRIDYGPSREFVPLAANEVISDAPGQIEIPVRLGPVFNEADLRDLPNGSWVLALEYEDVFGNTFYTLHSKSRRDPWSQLGRGYAPDTTPPPDVSALFLTPPLSANATTDESPPL